MLGRFNGERVLFWRKTEEVHVVSGESILFLPPQRTLKFHAGLLVEINDFPFHFAIPLK